MISYFLLLLTLVTLFIQFNNVHAGNRPSAALIKLRRGWSFKGDGDAKDFHCMYRHFYPFYQFLENQFPSTSPSSSTTLSTSQRIQQCYDAGKNQINENKSNIGAQTVLLRETINNSGLYIFGVTMKIEKGSQSAENFTNTILKLCNGIMHDSACSRSLKDDIPFRDSLEYTFGLLAKGKLDPFTKACNPKKALKTSKKEVPAEPLPTSMSDLRNRVERVSSTAKPYDYESVREKVEGPKWND